MKITLALLLILLPFSLSLPLLPLPFSFSLLLHPFEGGVMRFQFFLTLWLSADNFILKSHSLPAKKDYIPFSLPLSLLPYPIILLHFIPCMCYKLSPGYHVTSCQS